MAYNSVQYYKENPKGARMKEGWNKGCVPVDIQFITPRDLEKKPGILIKWRNTDDEVATDYLLEDSEQSNAKLAELAAIGGIVSWGDSPEGKDVADLLNQKIFVADVEVQYGKGDRAFIQSYAPSNSKAPTPQPKPEPAASGAPKRRSGF